MTLVVTRQRAQEVHDMARARAGLPYAYGGAFTRDPRRSTDCSGLVLQTAAWYGGRTDWPGNRYGSTESFRLDQKIVYDLGFKRLPPGGLASLPFKPVMLVGLQHGGGGENSHTACTMMTMDIPGGPVLMSDRGVDWESQGDGVFLYDGARAWNDDLFHDFWYLDAKLDAPVAQPEKTVPLAQKWTSPSPAWAHLIMRESGGNPTIIQQIHDVNSGGNEAEGLFQITPKTWRAHNGTEFAPSARLAAPQQQAIVAARIFTRNPSGSDWGAGLAGREDAQQLAAGLVLNRSQGDDELPAADIDKLIREIHGCLFNDVDSRCIYAPKGDRTWKLHELLKNTDGGFWDFRIESLARGGDSHSMSLLFDASQGLARHSDPWVIERALKVIKEIEHDNPQVLHDYLAHRKGPANA